MDSRVSIQHPRHYLAKGAPLDVQIASNDHGLFCVPEESMHRPCSREIIKGGVWESRTLDTLQSIMRRKVMKVI